MLAGKVPIGDRAKGSAVVLVSGGLDSTVVLALAIDRHGPENVFPLRFFYGQTHKKELERCHMICTEYYSLPLEGCTIDLPVESALVDQKEFNPSMKTRAVEQGLPPSFVPGRNAVMLSVAAGYAYGKRARYIYGGWNVVDYSGYPDCRPAFLHSMEVALRDGTDVDFEIVAPIIMLTKPEIIRAGFELKAPIHLTWSCYAGGKMPCEACESCKIRREAFEYLSIPDPSLIPF